MRHLYNVRVEVLELSGTLSDGIPTLTWTKLDDVVDAALDVAGELMCRLDLVFQRPGKDAPMPLIAGRAPDRVGVMLFDPTDKIKAGQRVHCLAGPVTGTYELRAAPDVAQALSTGHHMEVQVVEVAQAVAGVYPGSGVS